MHRLLHRSRTVNGSALLHQKSGTSRGEAGAWRGFALGRRRRTDGLAAVFSSDLGRALDDAGHLLAELLDVRIMKLELDRDFLGPDFF